MLLFFFIKVVCQHYWPTIDIEMYGEYTVTPLEGQTHAGYLERKFSLTDSKVRWHLGCCNSILPNYTLLAVGYMYRVL